MPEPPRHRVARLPYLNSAPFFLGWPARLARAEGRWSPVEYPPRQLGLAAEAGDVDAGLFAEADLARLEPEFAPLPAIWDGTQRHLGIACRDRVDSVLLFLRSETGVIAAPASPVPSGRVLSASEAARLEGAVIAFTDESSTSIRLLRLLLEVRFGVRPLAYRRVTLAPDRRPADDAAALLAIGDTALRFRMRPPDGFVLAMDLATAWLDWTGLPFVFARWGIRRSVSSDAAAWLGRFLTESLRAAQGRYVELVSGQPSALGSARDLGDYLGRFVYVLGRDELDGAARFRTLLEESGLPDAFA